MTDPVPARSKTFDKISYVEAGPLVMPDGARLSPQGRLRDLKPGEWAFGAVNSVLMDGETGILVLDTEDVQYCGTIGLNTFRDYPIIMSPGASFEAEEPIPLIADLRRLWGITTRNRDTDFSDGYGGIDLDSSLFRTYARRFGAQVLTGAIFNEYGLTHYVGKEAYISDAETLVEQVDRLFAAVSSSSKPVDQTAIVNLYSAQEPVAQIPPSE